MKKTLSFLLFLLISTVALAQDFPYGQVNDQALDMKKYTKDTSAHALILDEFASSRITMFGTSVDGLVYEYHVKIKFFDNKNFNKGIIEIPIHHYIYNKFNYDEISELKGSTYYKDDNGVVQSAELDTTSKVYETRADDGVVVLKFAMPAMRAGCIVEYKFRLRSPNNEYIPTWYFQMDIPKIHSEYNVHIPSLFTYNVVLKGPLKLTKTTAKIERACFTFRGVTNDCSDITYEMNDIPAFIEEEYTSSPKNFLSAINLELSEYTVFTGMTKKITSDWKYIDETLNENASFGIELNKVNPIKKAVSNALINKTDKLEKAKAIYCFMQRSFKWNHINSFFCLEGFKKLIDTRTGSAGDINLALIAALRSAGIQTNPVLLSTRNNGVVDRIYPTLENFNYVIAKVNIDDKEYFLDATDPSLSFGLLPLRCLNGQGRVISSNGLSCWTDLATSQKKALTYSFDLTLHDDGEMTGIIAIYSGGYSGYEKRKTISSFNTIDEYVESISEYFPKFKIVKSEIANVDSLDLPFSETYYVEVKNPNQDKSNRLSFNPFINSLLPEYNSTNPFKMDERTYPVDFGMPSNVRATFTIHLPSQYQLENFPKNVDYSLPGNSGKFATYFDNTDGNINFSHVIQLNKAIYDPNEYSGLKELFNKIILAEKSDIAFTKK